MDRCTCTPAMCESCPGKVVCRCMQVTEATLITLISTLELRSVKEVQRHTGAGAGCMCCHARIREYIDGHSAARPLTAIAG